MTDLLTKLCAVDGVSGDEGKVRDFIKAYAVTLADKVYEDTMGNLIVFKKGEKTPSKTVMLTAHMDEAGLMVTDITDDGYLKFVCVGDIDRRVLMGKEVYVGENRVYGVIGSKAIHLAKPDELGKIPKTDDMYIDIGAPSREEAEKLVSPADTVSFDNTVIAYGGGMIKGKGISGRASCFVLMKLMEKALPYDCTFVFTVQKEIGSRGVLGAAFRVKPDIALILDGIPSADVPSVSGLKKICSPKAGPVVLYMDKGTIYDKKLCLTLTETAQEKGIEIQTVASYPGKTDASGVQRSRGGVRTAQIGVAVRNINSPASTASIKDIEDLYTLAEGFLGKIGEEI